jgi:hypothetical protein
MASGSVSNIASRTSVTDVLLAIFDHYMMPFNLPQKGKNRGGFWCMCAADGEVSLLDHRVT